MKEKKIWGWISMGALCLLLLIGLLIVEIQDRESKQHRALVLQQAEPLERQRDELIARRDRLEREYYDQDLGQATEQLLFLELDPLLMEEVFPKLQERQITGVLGLYADNFPGDEGKLSPEELQNLLDAGWEICLVYQEGESFSAWDKAMTERLRREGLSKPETLYFPENSYDPTLEAQILSCGYRTVVQFGKNRMKTQDGNAADGLWFIGADPWNYAGVKDSLTDLVRTGGEHCYTVRFSAGREEYETIPFVNMLDFVETFRKNESLVITGFARAWELHDSNQNRQKAAEEAWRQEDRELQQQIMELNQQLHEIYGQWKGGNDD